MPTDVRARVSAAPLHCRACERDLIGGEQWQDANGYYYCRNCLAVLRSRAPHQTPLFKCQACERAWPLRGLSEREGRLVCRECVGGEGHGGPLPAPPRPTAIHDAPASPALAPSAAPEPIPAHLIHPPPPGLQPAMICPHCWHVFTPDRVVWVSQHADLLGDPVAGPEAQSRFRPTRFTPQGEALDAFDMACQVLACPRCHLVVPRVLAETSPLFLSIIGAPGSGKSHFLASMAWELRRVMSEKFAVAFNDADPGFNQCINRYEEMLFLQDRTDVPVRIPKTQMQGELYDQVRLGRQAITLPRPFLFTLRPLVAEGNPPPPWRVRLICMYDNAGEHYQPGMDSAFAPGTQHLAQSRALMFLYDPSQHPRFREACRSVSADPQLHAAARTQRQEQALAEAAARVRRYTGLAAGARHDRPLMVLVSKADMWRPLLGETLETEPLLASRLDPRRWAVDLPRIERTSIALRDLLAKHAPELVSAAEDFCQRVIYIPISSLGSGPLADARGQLLGVRPDQIRPMWVTVPLLYMLGKWSSGLVTAVGKTVPTSPAVSPSATGKHRTS